MAQYFDRKPSTQDLQHAKRIHEQQLKDHRRIQGEHAERQRREIKQALREGKDKADRFSKELQHHLEHGIKHLNEKDEQSMHGAHELQHHIHEVQHALHQAHQEVNAFDHLSHSEQARFQDGGAGLGLEGFIQAAVAVILILQRYLQHKRGLHFANEKAKELKSSINKVRATAKIRR